MIKLDSNENKLIHNINIKSIVGKLDPRDYPDITISALREKLSKKLNVPMDEIFCSNGSDMLIKIITFCLVKADEEILIPEVAFPTYEIAAKLKECKYTLVPLKNYGIDLDATLNCITDKTKLIWLSNPHNPTGTLLYQKEIEDFMDKVPEDVYVVLDEAYREYVADNFPDTASLYNKYKNLIFIRTLSKAYGLAGVRIGYGFARTNIVEKLKLGLGPFDVNVYAQELAFHMLDDMNYVHETRDITIQEMAVYEEFCRKYNLEYIKSYASFIMIKVDENEQPIYQYLLDNKIVIKPGSKIGMPGWIRVSVGLPMNNNFAIGYMEEFFKSLKDN